MNYFIHHILTERLKIPSEEAKEYNKSLAVQHIEKYGFFIEYGDVCESIAYVISGSFIGFNKDERKNAFLIVRKNEWAGDIVNFSKGATSQRSIMAIEDSEVLLLPRSFHNFMLENSFPYARTLAKELIRAIEKYEEKIMLQQISSIEDRIRYMKKSWTEWAEEENKKKGWWVPIVIALNVKMG